MNKLILVLISMLFIACKKTKFTGISSSVEIHKVIGSSDGSFTLTVLGKNLDRSVAKLESNENNRIQLERINDRENSNIAIFKVSEKSILNSLMGKMIKLLVNDVYAAENGFVLQGASAYIKRDESKGEVYICTKPNPENPNLEDCSPNIMPKIEIVNNENKVCIGDGESKTCTQDLRGQDALPNEQEPQGEPNGSDVQAFDISKLMITDKQQLFSTDNGLKICYDTNGNSTIDANECNSNLKFCTDHQGNLRDKNLGVCANLDTELNSFFFDFDTDNNLQLMRNAQVLNTRLDLPVGDPVDLSSLSDDLSLVESDIDQVDQRLTNEITNVNTTISNAIISLNNRITSNGLSINLRITEEMNALSLDQLGSAPFYNLTLNKHQNYNDVTRSLASLKDSTITQEQVDNWIDAYLSNGVNGYSLEFNSITDEISLSRKNATIGNPIDLDQIAQNDQFVENLVNNDFFITELFADQNFIEQLIVNGGNYLEDFNSISGYKTDINSSDIFFANNSVITLDTDVETNKINSFIMEIPSKGTVESFEFFWKDSKPANTGACTAEAFAEIALFKYENESRSQSSSADFSQVGSTDIQVGDTFDGFNWEKTKVSVADLLGTNSLISTDLPFGGFLKVRVYDNTTETFCASFNLHVEFTAISVKYVATPN